jgi:opacity protein-like surface antigen
MKTLHMIGASAVISMTLGGSAMADGIGLDTFYIGAAAGWDYSNYDSGGKNTLGFAGGGANTFRNTNDDSGGSAVGSFFLGFEDIVSLGPVSLRAELEGMMTSKEIVTDSFQPPSPTFFYDTEIRSYVGLFNLWADVRPMSDIPVVLSFGGGVGVARHEVETGDGIVVGDGSDTEFAFAVGAQAAYEFQSNVTVGMMGRYTDFGSPSIDLESAGLGTPSGNYSLDQSGVQIMGFIRFGFGPS